MPLEILSPNTHTSEHLLKGIAEEQPQLTLFWIAVVQKLRKQQMRRDGDKAAVHGEPAVFPCGGDILFYLSGIGRADVHDRAKGSQRLFFLFHGGHRRISGRVVIPLAVEFIDTHWIYLVSLSCKNPFHSRRREAIVPSPKAAFCPSGRRPPAGTFPGRLR